MTFNLKCLIALISVLCMLFAWAAKRNAEYKDAEQGMLYSEMKSFMRSTRVQMQRYSLRHPPTEWQTYDEAMAEVKFAGMAFHGARVFHNGYSPYESGLDPWGSKIVLLRGTRKNEWIIRSLGPNRVDEGGLGDDIEELVRMTWMPY